MDIANIKTGDRTVEILNPVTDAPLGIRWTIMHTDDDRLKPIRRRIQNDRNALEAKGKWAKADEVEANKFALMFGASLGWEWYNPTGKPGDEGYDPEQAPVFHDEVPTFNQRNVIAVLKELPWIDAQLQEAFGETKDFFAK